MSRYYDLYDELFWLTDELKFYYAVDKVKPYGVYVWTRGLDGQNVFDIYEDRVEIHVTGYEVPDNIKPIIQKIQNKLSEIRLSAKE